MSDNSSKTLMVDERQMVREVLDKLFEKTHCDCSINWSLCETNPELQIGEMTPTLADAQFLLTFSVSCIYFKTFQKEALRITRTWWNGCLPGLDTVKTSSALC